MAISQTIANAAGVGGNPRWYWNSAQSTGANWTINPQLVTGTDPVYFYSINFNMDGEVNFQISTGPSFDDTGPDFVSDFENEGIITVQAGIHVLILRGIGDASEPYSWTPGADEAEYGAFTGAQAVQEFRTAVTSGLGEDSANITLELDIGEEVDADPVLFAFHLPEPTVRHVRGHVVDASPAFFLFAVPEPAITWTESLDVDAGDINFLFNLPAPQVTLNRHYRIDANGADFAFNLPEPGIRHGEGHVVDADPVRWAITTEIPLITYDQALGVIMYAMEAGTDLLISQWQNAFRLRTQIQIFLDIVKEEIIDPMNRLQLMKRIDTAEGVWLDYIGERLGIIRPWVAVSITDDPRFGFDDAGTGFEQGRFADAISALNPRAPAGDRFFRNLLRARVITIRADGGIGDYLRSIREIDSGATIVDNHDMTVTITTTRQTDLEVAERVEAIAIPAGVRRIFA